MLEIFTDLEPFFQDNYRRIHVREYAKIRKISPPTAAKKLNEFHRQGLLSREVDKKYHLFFTNKTKLFIQLSHAYHTQKLNKLTQTLTNHYINPLIIVFGSFAKAEITPESDIDIAIFSPTTKKINLENEEKTLKRSIQLFTFKNKQEVKNKDLLNNILNGFIIAGE